MLEVRDLHKDYGGFKAVRGVTFEVARGEIVGFLGPNGAGKTTTMKIVVGFLTMSSGEVLVDGLDVRRDSLAVRERIGYLPESTPLYEDMTVKEYLSFVADVRGLRGSERRERLRHVLGVCGLEPKRRALVSTLSKGYRQRVGLAQAIVHDPKLVILDEPTVGLDPNQIVEIRELLREIGRRNTVILSSHILSEVEATCGRVVIIADGRIVGEGRPADLEAAQADLVSYRLRLRGGPAADLEEALAVLPGVEALRSREAGEDGTGYEFRAPPGEPFAEALGELTRARNLVISELSSSQPDLEEVFRRLTGAGRPASPAPRAEEALS